MEEDQKYGDLDEESLVYRQIDRVNRVTTYDLDNNELDTWKVFTTRLKMAVEQFEALLTPMIDKQYREEAPDLENMQEDNVVEKRRKILEKYKCLMSLMYRKNMYHGKSARYIIDQEEDPEEDSNVVLE